MLTRRAFGGALLGAAALSTGAISAAPHRVAIRGFAFEPARLTIRAGESVSWTNGDLAPHTATGTGWDSGALARGGTATIRFATPGRYPYVCAYHPHMTGEIVVQS